MEKVHFAGVRRKKYTFFRFCTKVYFFLGRNKKYTFLRLGRGKFPRGRGQSYQGGKGAPVAKMKPTWPHYPPKGFNVAHVHTSSWAPVGPWRGASAARHVCPRAPMGSQLGPMKPRRGSMLPMAPSVGYHWGAWGLAGLVGFLLGHSLLAWHKKYPHSPCFQRPTVMIIFFHGPSLTESPVGATPTRLY